MNSLCSFVCRVFIEFHVYYSVKWCIWIVESCTISVRVMVVLRLLLLLLLVYVCMNGTKTQCQIGEKREAWAREGERAEKDGANCCMQCINEYLYSYTIAVCQIPCISWSICMVCMHITRSTDVCVCACVWVWFWPQNENFPFFVHLSAARVTSATQQSNGKN